jgi:hypothetical protein
MESELSERPSPSFPKKIEDKKASEDGRMASEAAPWNFLGTNFHVSLQKVGIMLLTCVKKMK